jgi:hypothetical protein
MSHSTRSEQFAANKDIAPCALCGSGMVKAIYAGLPLRLCLNEDCSHVSGWASVLLNALPFNGAFMFYEGSYFPALIEWWRGPSAEDE